MAIRKQGVQRSDKARSRSPRTGRRSGSAPAGAAYSFQRIEAVMARAEEIGLTSNKEGRISGRVSLQLIAQAKAQTGLQSDTALIEYALANIALEDNFLMVFDAIAGTVDPDLDLEF